MKNIALLVPLIGILSYVPAVLSEPKIARAVVQAFHNTTLSSEISARITEIAFRPGESFSKNDLLIAFDCRIFEAQSDKVDADLRAAEIKLKNDRKLEKLGSIGVMDLVLSETALDQAKAESEMARINVKRCTISAPWNGKVVKNLAHEHESVELHKPLLNIISSDRLEVNLVVPSDWIRWVQPGMPFDLRVDETDTTHSASVVAIGSIVDPVSQTLSIRAKVDSNGALLPGMSGTAIFSAR